MGVDIYGRNPQIISEQPQIEFETASDDAKKEYFEAVRNWEDENPGYYFRSNWWGWRPIVYLIDSACNEYEVEVNTQSWHYNDGDGPKTQEECDNIANALEKAIESSSSLKDDDDMIFICLGSWCNSQGQFISKESEEELNQQYPSGQILIGSVITSNGEIVTPSHGTSYGRIKEFIKFLRNCGGFQVY
jgi:hypothetical protein